MKESLDYKDIIFSDINKKTPEYIAYADVNNIEEMEYILKCGINPNYLDAKEVVSNYGPWNKFGVGIIKLLYDYGRGFKLYNSISGSISYRFKYSHSDISVALSSHNMSAVKFLIKNKHVDKNKIIFKEIRENTVNKEKEVLKFNALGFALYSKNIMGAYYLLKNGFKYKNLNDDRRYKLEIDNFLNFVIQNHKHNITKPLKELWEHIKVENIKISNNKYKEAINKSRLSNSQKQILLSLEKNISDYTLFNKDKNNKKQIKKPSKNNYIHDSKNELINMKASKMDGFLVSALFFSIKNYENKKELKELKEIFLKNKKLESFFLNKVVKRKVESLDLFNFIISLDKKIFYTMKNDNYNQFILNFYVNNYNKYKNPNIIKKLDNLLYDISKNNKTDYKRNTILHLLIKKYIKDDTAFKNIELYVKLCNLIVNFGIDPNIKNKNGLKAKDLLDNKKVLDKDLYNFLNLAENINLKNKISSSLNKYNRNKHFIAGNNKNKMTRKM